jgi:hypothetical protein
MDRGSCAAAACGRTYRYMDAAPLFHFGSGTPYAGCTHARAHARTHAAAAAAAAAALRCCSALPRSHATTCPAGRLRSASLTRTVAGGATHTGLSYTTFTTRRLRLSSSQLSTADCVGFNLTVTLTNTGSVDGDEVTQVPGPQRHLNDAPCPPLTSHGASITSHGASITLH